MGRNGTLRVENLVAGEALTFDWTRDQYGQVSANPRMHLRNLSGGEMAYVYLAIAIMAEVFGTTSLKASEEFTRLAPSLAVAAGYSVSFYFLSLVLRSIPLGITYAVWSGLGVVLVAIAGAVVYEEVPDAPAALGMTMIVGGVIVMNVFSKTVIH